MKREARDKKMKNLKQKIRTGIGAGIIMFGGLVGGCGDLNPYQEQTMYSLTGLAYDYTMQQERNKAIREVGSEGGGNIREENEREVTGDKIRVFTCNYFKNFDNDTYAKYPEEFFGIKNKFRKDEILTPVIFTGVPDNKEYNLSLKIYNSRGEDILNSSSIGRRSVKFYNPEQDVMGYILNKSGIGTYKLVAYVNGEFIGSHEFEIIE